MYQKTLAKDGLTPLPTISSSSLSDIDFEIIRAIRSIGYGSVEITIHDSRVVQIERKEKRRFEASRQSVINSSQSTHSQHPARITGSGE